MKSDPISWQQWKQSNLLKSYTSQRTSGYEQESTRIQRIHPISFAYRQHNRTVKRVREKNPSNESRENPVRPITTQLNTGKP